MRSVTTNNCLSGNAALSHLFSKAINLAFVRAKLTIL
jgi:hypothetical protein